MSNAQRQKRYRAKHQAQYKAVLQEYKAKHAPYEETPDDPERVYKTAEQMYCANYDPEYLSCIKCYENQAGQYKECYKRG